MTFFKRYVPSMESSEVDVLDNSCCALFILIKQELSQEETSCICTGYDAQTRHKLYFGKHLQSLSDERVLA